MRYINKKTGAIIDSPSKISGKNWVEYKHEKDRTEKQTEEYVEEEIDLEAMTKDQLIEFAKEQGIEVNEKENKSVIIETIAKAFE